MENESTQVRLSAIGIVCLVVFGTLLVRLWFLQGIDRQEFQVASQSNRLRVVHEEAPRGRILDRNGKVIVDNRTALVVLLNREPIRKLDESERGALFDRIANALTDRFQLPIKASRIQARYNDGRWGPLEHVPLVTDVPEGVDLYFSEHNSEFPGVVVERRALRSYPYGSVAAHLLGYVGEINEKELAARQATDGTPEKFPESVPVTDSVTRPAKPYARGDTIGKGGVEAAYEAELRGVPGRRVIEVNARGEFVSQVSHDLPKRGDDLWLNIDIDLQAHAERTLEMTIAIRRFGQDKDGRKYRAPEGSVVVTDPRNGAVLALASYPTYQPNDLVNGIPTELWERLNGEEEGRPFFNRVTQGAYPAASTFKLFTSFAGWQRGLLRPETERFFDNGTFTLQNCRGEKCEFRNAGGVRNGMIDLARAITVSSDVYYYHLAEQFWLNRSTYGETPIQDAAAEFGLGKRTGIDLPGETSGVLPTPAKRKAAYEANKAAFMTGDWRTGDNLNTAIGQGDVLVSPLQLNMAYAAFANGGVKYQPQLGQKLTRQNDLKRPPGEAGNFTVIREISAKEIGRVNFTSQEEYQRLWTGFAGVVQTPAGTAYDAFKQLPTAWPMAGKTGTAENKVPDGSLSRADSSLFAGWGPALAGADPQFAATAIIPEAGFGSEAAAPVVFGVLKPVSEGNLPPACLVKDPAEVERCRNLSEQTRLTLGPVLTQAGRD